MLVTPTKCEWKSQTENAPGVVLFLFGPVCVSACWPLVQIHLQNRFHRNQ